MGYNLLNLANTDLSKAVVRCFEEESTLFTACPVLEVKGSALAYNQVDQLFEVEKRELGQEVINVQEMVTNKVVEDLNIYSNSVRVDRAMVLMSDIDVRAVETELQAKSMARGVHKEIIKKLKENAGVKVTTVGAMPTCEEVCLAIDEMQYSEDSMLLLANGKTLRALTKEAEKEGYLHGQIDAFGKHLPSINGVPCQVTRDLNDGEILVIYFSVADGVCLGTNSGLLTYDKGLQQGVHYITDMELLAVAVVKNTKSVAYINKAAK